MLTKKSKKKFLHVNDIEEFGRMFARLNDKVGYRALEGKTVLLNLETGHYFSLDEVGSRIWQALRENKSLFQIACETAKFFKIGRKEVSFDILKLVNELIDTDLLELRRDI